jgi:hypothetical protein
MPASPCGAQMDVGGPFAKGRAKSSATGRKLEPTIAAARRRIAIANSSRNGAAARLALVAEEAQSPGQLQC